MTRPLPVLLALGLLPGGLVGQVPDSVRQDTILQDTILQDTIPSIPRPPEPIAPRVVQDSVAPTTPGAAFIRSLVLPGWGQAEYDAYFRGSVYFAGWVGNWFMNFRNFARLNDVRERLDLRRDQIEASLVASSTNPDSMRAQIDSFPDIMDTAVREDPVAGDLLLLEDARVQQREDWIAWSIFWLLASGVDAYVTAHLSDFPAEVDIRPTRGGSMTLQVGVPWGPGRGLDRPPDARSPGTPPSDGGT